MSNQVSHPSSPILQLDQELVERLVVHKNLDPEVIVTTVDKVKLNLIEHQNALKAKRDWIAPLGVLVSLVVTLLTATFKNLLGLSPDIWQALFIFASFVCFLWLAYAIYNAVSFRSYGNEDDFIESLKGNNAIK